MEFSFIPTAESTITMNFLIILLTLASAQNIKSEIPDDKVTPATNTEVIVKNKIVTNKTNTSTSIQPTAVVAAVKAKLPTVEVKTYDDGVLRNSINDLSKRQSQQEIFIKRLFEDVSFIKNTLIKIVNQNDVWTVIQRRQDGSVNFDRTWDEYKEGFGDSQGEFFIGLDNLHEMTAEPHELLIILEDFENKTRYAKYDKFKVASEDDKYAIEELGEYSGTAGDSLSYHRTRKFSTKDQDNDLNEKINCAAEYKSGWWFDKCYSSNLNGPYYKGARSCRGGINWYHWHNYMYSLKFTEMMIRAVKSEDE